MFRGFQPDLSSETQMRQQFPRRHARNGRASANYSINDVDRGEVRLSIGLGGNRFINVGLSIAQAEAAAEALLAALRDGEVHRRQNDGEF